MKSNVINLSDKLKDGTMHTPKQALESALSYIGKEGAFKEGTKILIIAVDDSEGHAMNWVQAGMKMSECIALCEIAKINFLTQMEYVPRC